MYTPKPKTKLTDDICAKHNRRLRDYEMIAGCIECAREEKAAEVGKSTTVHVLPPEKGSYCKEKDCHFQCSECRKIENNWL